MKFYAVIGAGFGDEGKGSIVDFVCSQMKNSLVIRYCGGHQAGHTVCLDNVSHIFSGFGSGSLRGVPTYWSEYCPFDLISLMNEYKFLEKKGVKPILYISENAPVVTLCDIQMNLWQEEQYRHGSCGVGVGTTLKREEDHYHLQYKDLFYPEILKIKLDLIKKYYSYDYERTLRDEDLKLWMKSVDFITNNPDIRRGFPEDNFTNYIFEGAQGLLLDQNIGFFPHVTRGNTGTKNILSLIKKHFSIQDPEIDLWLVTRAYQTRHGNGPMTNEKLDNKIKIPDYETNKYNENQGDFRYSILDLDLLNYAINNDLYIKKFNKNMIVTCVDQIQDNYRFTCKGKLTICDSQEEFFYKIKQILKIKKIYFNISPNAKTVKYRRGK